MWAARYVPCARPAFSQRLTFVTPGTAAPQGCQRPPCRPCGNPQQADQRCLARTAFRTLLCGSFYQAKNLPKFAECMPLLSLFFMKEQTLAATCNRNIGGS